MAPLLTAINRFRSAESGSTLAGRFTSGVFWSVAGNVAMKLFTAISSIAVARILGPEGLGRLGMVQSTVAVFSVYAGFRMGNTAVKYVSEYRANDPEKAASILRMTTMVTFVLSAIVGIALLALAPMVAVRLLKEPDLSTPIRIGSLLIFFSIYGAVRQQALAGFEDFKSIAKINVTRGVLTPLICIPLALFWGVPGAVLGFACVAALVVPQATLYLRRNGKRFNFPVSVDWPRLKAQLPVLWSFALPGFLVLLLMALTAWLGRLILTRQGNGMAALGLFEAANQWRTIVLFLPTTMARVVLPILCDTRRSGNGGDYGTAVAMQIRTVSLLTLPLIMLLIMLASPLSMVYGAKFSGIEAILPILLASVYFSALNESTRLIYESSGRQWTGLGLYAIWGSVHLAACWLLVPRHGVYGFALAHLVSEVVLFLLQAFVADLYLSVKSIRLQFPLILLAGLLFGFACIARDMLQPSAWGTVSTVLVVCSLVPLAFAVREFRSQGAVCR